VVQESRQLSKDFDGERRSKGITLAEGDNFVRIVRDAYGKAVVHWTENPDGGNVRLCCPGGYRKQGMAVDKCPACQLIRDEREAGVPPPDQRCSWQRKFYLAAVPVTFVKKKRWKKGKDGKKVPVMKDGKQATKQVPVYGDRIELLGGRDGIGPQIFESIADFAAMDSYGAPTKWIVNIKKTGSGRATRYTVQPIPPAESGKMPDLSEMSDPMDLLGDGLLAYQDPTPLGEIYMALGISEGIEGDVDVDAAFDDGDDVAPDEIEDEEVEDDESEDEEVEDDESEDEEVEDNESEDEEVEDDESEDEDADDDEEDEDVEDDEEDEEVADDDEEDDNF